MPEYCEIIENREYTVPKTKHVMRGKKVKSPAVKEAEHAKTATFDLLEIKRFYMEGRSPEWISDNTQACSVTFKPINPDRIRQYVRDYAWAPMRAAYKQAKDEIDKEWIEKAAKQAAESYRQGVIAGKAEQTAFYERTFTEKMTDKAELAAQKLMDEGNAKAAMELTYQIERLRRMKAAPVKLKPVTKNDSEPDEADCDDLTMQLLDQAVAETEKVAGGR